jgi:uncharacterized protein YceK
MRAIVGTLVAALLAVTLQGCGSVQGCTQIAQKSEGPCRVGLPQDWYYDDSWRTQ